MMIRIPKPRCKVALLAALLLWPAGCQQMGAMFGSRKTERAASNPASISSFGQHTPPDALGATQKADIEMALARSVERQGHADQAITMYLDVVRKDDRRADAYHRLAILHDRKGECQTAEKFYRAAVQRAPENAEVHCDFGYSLYLQRRWDEAERSLRQALAIQPDLARAHNNLGLLLARTGRGDEALVEFRRAGCAEAEARANLALALMLDQRLPDAYQQYQLALTADPRSQAARAGMDALQSLDPNSQSSRWTSMDPTAGATPTRTAYVGPERRDGWSMKR
jgi:Flp pilus assembly protein TadD